MRWTLLSPELLTELEQQLRRVGAAPVVDHLAPGLEDAELAVFEQQLGSALPVEARTWWSWRNGGAEVLPHITMISLEWATDGRQWLLDRATSIAAAEPAPPLSHPRTWWRPSWLPWLAPRGSDFTSLDCFVAPGAASPVRRPDWTRVADADYDEAIAGSLGAIVEDWVALLAADRVVFDASSGTWQWISANKLLRRRPAP